MRQSVWKLTMANLTSLRSARQIERLDMVRSQIEPRGIRDPRVLEAMRSVPRELFLASTTQRDAYEDRALPIGYGQTISQPFIVAYMTEVLEVEAHHRVLEIGTGSGYQTAILAALCLHVDTVERIAALVDLATGRFDLLGIENVKQFVGDGSVGLPDRAPYDRILVTAGAKVIPPPLIDQLANEGVIVMPVGGSDEQAVTCLRRESSRIVEQRLLPCRFVRLIGEEGWKEENST